MDWLGKMLNLPEEFLASSGGKGGGVIQGSASEATLVALLGAKAKMMKKVKKEHPEWEDHEIIQKLVGYNSAQAHSSVERAGLLGGVKLRSLKADSENQLRGQTLEEAVQADLDAGLIPFFVSRFMLTGGVNPATARPLRFRTYIFKGYLIVVRIQNIQKIT